MTDFVNDQDKQRSKEHRGKDRRFESGFTTVELVIVAPVLLGLIFTIVHIGLLFHSSNVTNDIATVALRQGQRENGTADQAQAAGLSLAGREGGLSNTIITVTRTDQRVVVNVEADGVAVLPLLPRHLHRRVEGPVERFIPESDRP